jgi:hypothetical protein
MAIAVKDDDRRVFALEGIDAVLGVGGDRAHHGEGLARRELGPVLD